MRGVAAPASPGATCSRAVPSLPLHFLITSTQNLCCVQRRRRCWLLLSMLVRAVGNFRVTHALEQGSPAPHERPPTAQTTNRWQLVAHEEPRRHSSKPKRARPHSRETTELTCWRRKSLATRTSKIRLKIAHLRLHTLVLFLHHWLITASAVAAPFWS